MKQLGIPGFKSYCKSADFSECRTWRYALWRTWDRDKPYCLFICLNPSTADETTDDNTVRRCISYAQAWGHGGFCMANLFAYRATKPNDMIRAWDPVGPENDYWLKHLATNAGLVVAGWGNHGRFMDRSKTVRSMIDNLYYLQLTESGEPGHPLYLPKNLKPIPLKQAA